MNAEAFKAAYNAPRNGANEWLFHRLYPRLMYSDGVQSCAAAGCYWLLDILGTEGVQAVGRHRQALDGLGFIVVHVTKSKAVISLRRDTVGSDEAALWRRDVDYTDLPEGRWVFYLADDGWHVRLFLPPEY